MKHGFAQKNLSAYLDAELSPDKVQKIELHLQSCESCLRELQEIRSGKAVATCFENPDWQDTEALWQNIQRLNISTPEKGDVKNLEMKRTNLWQRLIHPRPAFAIAVLLILFGINLFSNLKQKKFQYQRVQLDQALSYGFDYGLYLDALVAGSPAIEFERRYESQQASYEQARSQTTFRLASFTHMPKTFQLREVRLLKNACCRSVQFSCLENSREVIIFQQPQGHPVTFGNYPLERIELNGQMYHRIKTGKWTVLSLQLKESQFMAIGEMNESDIAAIIFAITTI